MPIDIIEPMDSLISMDPCITEQYKYDPRHTVRQLITQHINTRQTDRNYIFDQRQSQFLEFLTSLYISMYTVILRIDALQKKEETHPLIFSPQMMPAFLHVKLVTMNKLTGSD